ncbi:SLAP domain-containing protein [Lactobacillus crispatus]|uniref:SEC10/PgrA surface exclusion domain-containing protein n=1 Tax=Lactobacillus crispatus TaxID=47770 RepID=UPI0018E318F4|nr:SEC10/PgrA surface exclusion domain-containing protein [Lactobacillus crispatus]MBI1721097.1 SLAP domain-containing protein [Lactobacillus crispatus]
MNRKFRVTSLTAAALASLFLAGANLSNEVKADVNPESTKAQAHSAIDNAKANVDSAQKEVDNAQADVDAAEGALGQAQSNAQGPNAAYAEQSGKTNAAKKDAADKANKLADAKKNEQAAEDLVKEATPSNIQSAKDAVKNQHDNVIPAADNAKRDADNAVANKKQDVATKEAAVKNAQDTVDSKQNAKDQADHNVQVAEDALKGTGIPTARKKLDDATIAKNAAQSAFNQADTDVQAKQTAKASAVTDLSNAQTTKNNADNAQSAAQSAFDTADRAAAAANQAVKNKQNEIDQLATQLGQLQDMTKNTINLVDVDKFKQAYADYLSDNELNGEDIQWADNAIEANHFVSSDTDKKIMVDVNNITPNQMKELALFTADLLNKVKNQIVPGSGKDEVTEQAINFTKQIAQRYVTDQENGSWNSHINWHDATGINDLSKADGLVSNEKSDRDKEQLYEDKDERWLPNPVSMDALKHNIYNSLREMIIPFGHGVDELGGTTKYEMAHTAGLLGLDSFSGLGKNRAEVIASLEHVKAITESYLQAGQGYIYGINGKKYENEQIINFVNDTVNKLNNHTYYIGANNIQDKQYVAATFSLTGREPFNGNPHMNIHFINISPDQIKDPAKFGTTVVKSYADQMAAVQQQIDYKNNELTPLQAAADRANAEKKAKEDALTAAKKAAKDAQTALTSAQNSLTAATNALTAAQQNQQNKQSALQTATATFNSAKQDYDVLTASNAVKAANLNRAKAAQIQAETELANAKTALKNAQDNLDNAKSELANLEKTAQEKADAAKKAQDDLTKLQKRVSDLQNAPQILTNAKAATAEAQADYTAAKKAADDAEKALQKLASAKSSADAQVASAQSAYEAAKATLDTAKDKLAKAQAELARVEAAEKRASSFTNNSSESANTKTMVLNHNARIYNSEGKQAKKPSLKKGETIKAWNHGKLVTIKGHKYYQIGKDEFVRADNVSKVKKVVKKSTKKATTKTVRLSHNAFVYTKSGKAIRKGLHFKFVKRGKSIKALHNGKVVMIKGHEYYQIGKNEFVKVANGDVKTKAVNVCAEVKGSKKVRAYDRSGKLNNHYLKAHHVYTFNEKKTINGKTYYKVKWTNNWVPANVLKFRK